MNIEGFIHWFLFVTISFMLIAVMVASHRRLLKSNYIYWWITQSIGYPITRTVYKKRIRYLSVKELDKVTDELVMLPDTWFVRELLVLVINQRLKLEDYV